MPNQRVVRGARWFALPLFAILLATAPVRAQDIASFEKRITVKTLANGVTVIVCERPEAPVFSFFTMVDAGSAQELPGITGLAHMFEHMAFKGTDKIGTTNYAAERKALAAVETAYAAYDRERRREPRADSARVAAAEKAWKDAIAAADAFVVKNEFGDLVERAGGVGLNAFTAFDITGYHYSLPSNRVELWAYLESERFLHPVMREFYKERDVVYEERRMRVESNPIGKLLEQFLAAAFTAHAYGHAGIGWPSDLHTFSATDAERFFQTYYGPSNLTVAVAGDVKASDLVPMLEKYFARLPVRPAPEEVRTVEPPQETERVVRLFDASQPIYIEGYHRPSMFDRDDAVYDAIADILSTGRVSRLYRSLVRDKKIAAQAGGIPALPGTKYPSLFALYGVPTPGHTNDEVREAIRAEITRLKNEDVTDAELRMVKTRAKANLLRGLGSNEGLAQQLAMYQKRYGDWRELFRTVDRIDAVTKEDVRRVANETFRDANRTVGEIVTTPAAQQKGGAQ